MNVSVGLDIGWKDVKALELTDDLKVRKFGRIEIPRPAKNDEDELYTLKIIELFSTHKFSKYNVIINLRGFPIIARTYTPPSERKDDFEKWFVESIESLIPGTPIADVIYGYQFLKSGRALISFARLRAIENKIKILKACDIIPAAIDAACLALYHAFDIHPLIHERKNFAILDISTRTDLLIIKEGEPFISTEIFFDDKGLLKETDNHPTFIDDLSLSLEKVFHFYRRKDNLNVERLILVGDYVDLPGLDKKLKQTLGVEAEIGDPFKLRKIDLPDNSNPKNSHHYTQSLGLALKGLSEIKDINLMPPEVKDLHRTWRFNEETKNFFQKSMIISSIVFVVLLFMLYTVINANHRIGKEVNNLKAKISELSYVNEVEKELNAKLKKLRQLGKKPFVWSEMLYDIGAAVPDGIYLKNIATETHLTSADGSPEKKTRVVIEGDAKDEETVLAFLKNLEKYYQHIAINKMEQEARCEFEISLTH